MKMHFVFNNIAVSLAHASTVFLGCQTVSERMHAGRRTFFTIHCQIIEYVILLDTHLSSINMHLHLLLYREMEKLLRK